MIETKVLDSYAPNGEPFEVMNFENEKVYEIEVKNQKKPEIRKVKKAEILKTGNSFIASSSLALSFALIAVLLRRCITNQLSY